MSISAKRDRANEQQFHAVVKQAYETAKKAGHVPQVDVSIYDKLIDYPAILSLEGPGGWVRPVQVRKQWKRKVARLYAKQTKKPLRGMFDNLDWEAIMAWVIENIIPIMKMFLMLVMI